MHNPVLPASHNNSVIIVVDHAFGAPAIELVLDRGIIDPAAAFSANLDDRLRWFYLSSVLSVSGVSFVIGPPYGWL